MDQARGRQGVGAAFALGRDPVDAWTKLTAEPALSLGRMGPNTSAFAPRRSDCGQRRRSAPGRQTKRASCGAKQRRRKSGRSRTGASEQADVRHYAPGGCLERRRQIAVLARTCADGRKPNVLSNLRSHSRAIGRGGRFGDPTRSQPGRRQRAAAISPVTTTTADFHSRPADAPLLDSGASILLLTAAGVTTLPSSRDQTEATPGVTLKQQRRARRRSPTTSGAFAWPCKYKI